MSEEGIKADSLVTLRYRLSCEGRELVSTMDEYPATFQLGTGELAPPLEECMLGLTSGARAGFDLQPEAFGAHNPQLVRRIGRDEMPADMQPAVGEAMTIGLGGGQQATGLIREVSTDSVLVDLNHPLAGKSVKFEVDVVGVL